MKIIEILKYIMAYIAALIFFCAAKLIWITCKKEKIVTPEFAELEASDRPFAYAFWHGRLFAFASLKPRHRKVYTIVSRHGDGQFISDVMAFYGIDSIRGSTNRARNDISKLGVLKSGLKDRGGAFVIREAIRTLRRGDCVAVTPDGPKGPRFVFKNNFLNVVSLAKVPIVPGSFSASRAWVLPSWDRFIIPKPFSKIKIIYGDLIHIPRLGSQEETEKYGKQVENALNDITSKLDAEFNIELNK